MAANKKIAVDIVAKDDASATLDKVADKAEKLDGESIEISADVKGVLKALDQVAAETKEVAAAADALGQALGPELAAKADTTAIVQDLRNAGLTMDEITANADQLGAKLKELSDIDVGGKLGANLGTTRGRLDELGVSASSSRSVLANMVGNATQDLGALSGIAGSAGVAIGQMGEYMADAAANGDSLGQIVGNFSKVLGPIAALSIGVGLVTKVMGDIKKKNEEIAQSSEALAEQITDDFRDIEASSLGISTVTSFYDALAASFVKTEETSGRTLQAMDALDIKASELGTTLAALDQGTAGRIAFFENFISNSDRMVGATDDIAASVGQAIQVGENFADIYSIAMQLGGKAAGDFVQDNRAMIEALEQLDDAAQGISVDKVIEETRDALLRSEGGLEAWGRAWDEALPTASDLEILNAALLIYNSIPEAAERWATANKPMEDMPAEWNAVGAAADRLRRGINLTSAEQRLIDRLMKAYGLTADQVLSRSIDFWEQNADAALESKRATQEALQAVADGAVDAMDAMNEIIAATVEYSSKTNDAEQALRDLADAQDGLQSDALSEALDIGDNAIDTLTSIQKINDGFRDLAEFINDPEGLKGAIPDIFDPDDVNSGEFLSKISSLKGPIQDQVAQVFGEAGPNAALAIAESFVKSLSDQTGISPEAVRNLLGLGDMTLKFKVAIEQSEIEKAKLQLDLLTGLIGETMETVSLRLALEAGTLTGQEAQALIQNRLRGAGVTIPTTLAVPDTDKVLADAQRKLDTGVPLNVPVNTTPVSTMGLQYNPRAPGASVTNVTNNYVPGSPTSTVDLFNLNLERNGSRTNG